MMDRGNLPERRGVTRIPGDTFGALQVIAQPTGELLSANVWDISIKGIGLLADRRVEPGIALAMRAESPAGRMPASQPALKAEVRHASQLPDGRWLMGCTFARLLTPEDVAVLG